MSDYFFLPGMFQLFLNMWFLSLYLKIVGRRLKDLSNYLPCSWLHGTKSKDCATSAPPAGCPQMMHQLLARHYSSKCLVFLPPPHPKTFAPLYDLVIHAGITFCHKDYKLENLSDHPLLLSIEQQSSSGWSHWNDSIKGWVLSELTDTVEAMRLNFLPLPHL